MKSTKKTLLSVAVIAAMLLSTACASGTKAETTAKTTEAAPAVTTAEETTAETTEETTVSEEETTAAETDASTEESLEADEPEEDATDYGTPVDVVMPNGETRTLLFFKNDWGGYDAVENNAFLRHILPNSYTSVERPDSFNLPEYTMTDSAEKFDDVEFPEVFAVGKGDYVGSLKVLDAYIQYQGTDYSGTIEATPFSSELHFDGVLTLSGDFVYITEDEYGTAVGDVFFYPNQTEAERENFSTMASFYGSNSMSMTAWEKVPFGAYGDVCPIYLGNMLQGEGIYDYSNRPEILAVFDGSKNVLSGVATILNITLTNSEQFGIRCSATAFAINAN